MKRVAIIPARGGSVRIPRKNIIEFHGKPMITYPIQAARQSGLFDKIIVSTDDDEIAACVDSLYRCAIERAGLPAAWSPVQVHRRPPCDGTMGTQEVAALVLSEIEPCDAACVIYPCTPMITQAELRLGWRLLHSRPWWSAFVMAVHEPLADAGQFYWGWADAFTARLPLISVHTTMAPVPSTYIDINTPEDLRQAEANYAQLRSTGHDRPTA